MILMDAHRRHDWLEKAVNRRLREELAKLRVEINEDQSGMVDLKKGESFTFLGFEIRRVLSRNRKWRPNGEPKLKSAAGSAAQAKGSTRRRLARDDFLGVRGNLHSHCSERTNGRPSIDVWCDLPVGLTPVCRRIRLHPLAERQAAKVGREKNWRNSVIVRSAPP